MIITRPYFIGDIAIANAGDTAPNMGESGNAYSLEQYIFKYERVILTEVFGYTLYAEFKAQFNINQATGVWKLKPTAPEKWGDLLNGKEYTKNDYTVYWPGLIFKDGSINDGVQQSLIAYYVYAKFMEDDEYSHSGVGMQAEQSKNSVRVSSRGKIADAYNAFYLLTVGDEPLTPDGQRSLYEFIQDMNDVDDTTYVKWRPKGGYKLVNRFGL